MEGHILVCKIPLLARALGIKAEQPLGQARATIGYLVYMSRTCMQDTFARATHSAYAAGRPSAARDDRVSCIQVTYPPPFLQDTFKFARALCQACDVRLGVVYCIYYVISQGERIYKCLRLNTGGWLLIT